MFWMKKAGVKNDEQFYFIYFRLHWVFITACRLSLVAARLSLVASQGCSSVYCTVSGVHRPSGPEASGIFLDQGSNLCPPHQQADL